MGNVVHQMRYAVLAAAEIRLRETVAAQDSAKLRSQIAVTTKDAYVPKTNVAKATDGVRALLSAFSLSSLAPEVAVPT